MTEKKRKGKDRKPIDKEKARRFTCLVCPACCELETDGVEVVGARCPKGEAFARQEMVMPMRVLTTTVRCETSRGAVMIPVKTAFPVPLARIFEIMKGIKTFHLSEAPAFGGRFSTGSAEEPVEWIVTGEPG